MRPPGSYQIDGVWYRAGRRSWTADEDAIIRARYPHEKTVKLLDALPWRPASTIHKRAAQLGIKKTAEFTAGPDGNRLKPGSQAGKASQFKKGSTPANKGTRRPGWHAGRMQETQFKKGNRTNWMPVNSTRLVDGYVYRKVSDIPNVPWTRNWRQEHYIIWEKARGPIPKGHNVYFLDGDRTHVTLENLGLISRAEWLAMRSIHTLPDPLKKTIHLLGALTRRINRKAKDDGKRHHGTEGNSVRHVEGVEAEREPDGAGSREGHSRRRAGDGGNRQS